MVTRWGLEICVESMTLWKSAKNLWKTRSEHKSVSNNLMKTLNFVDLRAILIGKN